MGQTCLQGKTALVTGAAKRLGLAIATGLAEQGANVVIHYATSRQEAENARDDLRKLGVAAHCLQADLGDPDQAQGLVSRAAELASPLDILVNNASIFDRSKLSDVSFGQVSENIGINAWAPFVLSRAFAAQRRPGRILNLMDTRIASYDWHHVAYMLSKQMLALLTRMTALEYAPDITVNAVAPGLIIPPPGEDTSYLERRTDTVSLKRHGDVQDVVDAALFLIRSEFITGQTIYVDGGRHLRG